MSGIEKFPEIDIVKHLTDKQIEEFKAALDKEVERRIDEAQKEENRERRARAKKISIALDHVEVQEFINLIVPEHNTHEGCSDFRTHQFGLADNSDTDVACTRCCLVTDYWDSDFDIEIVITKKLAR